MCVCVYGSGSFFILVNPRLVNNLTPNPSTTKMRPFSFETLKKPVSSCPCLVVGRFNPVLNRVYRLATRLPATGSPSALAVVTHQPGVARLTGYPASRSSGYPGYPFRFG